MSQAGYAPMDTDYFEKLREQMLEDITRHTFSARAQINKDRLSERVLAAVARVARHEFVPVELQLYAYSDTPLPIGHDKTISQPFIVALMTDLLGVDPEHRVLEIGTGLGYQAAVLAELCDTVYSVELIEELATAAEKRLTKLGYTNAIMRTGDGSRGWAEHAPFDRIIVTAAPDLIPPALIDQLRPGGRMVIPAGLLEAQKLMVLDKGTDRRITTAEVLAVRFSELATDEQPRVC